MLFWILYILSIVVCFFLARKTLSIEEDIFDDEMAAMILYIFFGVLPFVNVLIYLVYLAYAAYEDSGSDVSEVAKKIFFVKDDDKK